MASGHSAIFKCVSVVVITSFVLAGCSRTFIFGPDQIPNISDGELHVHQFERSHSPVDSLEIKRIGIRHRLDPNVLRAPTRDESMSLLEGRALDVYAVEIDVDASEIHWRDYGLGGAGIGVSLALIGNLSDDNNALFAGNDAVMLFGTAVLGVIGFLAGLIGGSLAAPDFVDMRYLDGVEHE